MTNMNAAATTSYNTAAQNIKVNRKMRTLEISKTFEKAASRYGSDEYIALMHAQMENPGYSVKVVTRKGGSKQPYAGLTFEYMKKYISMHDTEDGAIMKIFVEMRAKDEESELLGMKSESYQDILAWFLDTFPAIKAHHDKREAEMAARRQKLAAEKEARRLEAKRNAA